jgi:hypothetical protein
LVFPFFGRQMNVLKKLLTPLKQSFPMRSGLLGPQGVVAGKTALLRPGGKLKDKEVILEPDELSPLGEQGNKGGGLFGASEPDAYNILVA